MTTTELLQSLVGEPVTVTPEEGRKVVGVLAEVTVGPAGDVDSLVIQQGTETNVVRWESVARIRHDRSERVA